MPAFGVIPAEPPRLNNLADCAPLFAAAVRLVLVDLTGQGYPPIVFEALRTNERQSWLYGFGRGWDDGRGIITKAPTGERSWHAFGAACDIIHRDRGWAAPGFFAALGVASKTYGLTWGGTWRSKDLPHVQWGKCRKSPSAKAAQLFAVGGLEAVWRAVGAMGDESA